MLLRASTEATWITAPEVSGKAVNINDSYHPPPGLLQPSRLLFSSSPLFKGKNPAQSKGKVLLARKFFFRFFFLWKSHSTLCIAGFKPLKVQMLFHQITTPGVSLGGVKHLSSGLAY